MDGVEVRLAMPPDAAAIGDVEVSVQGPYEQLHEAALELIRKDLSRIAAGLVLRRTWVATVGQDIVGFAKCSYQDRSTARSRDLPEGWYLSGITVARPWRRKGIGRRLVQVRLDWLHEQTTLVYYNTGLENDASVALHSTFGFERVEPDVLAPAPHGRRTLQRLFRRTGVPDSDP